MIKTLLSIIIVLLNFTLFAQKDKSILDYASIAQFDSILHKYNWKLETIRFNIPEDFLLCLSESRYQNKVSNFLEKEKVYFVYTPNTKSYRYRAVLYFFKDENEAEKQLNNIETLLQYNNCISHPDRIVYRCLKGYYFFTYKEVLVGARCFNIYFPGTIEKIIDKKPIHYKE